jgi:hypothetical protein
VSAVPLPHRWIAFSGEVYTRTYDATGLPLHFDNDSTIKERNFLDKNDPNILHTCDIPAS